jgi:hypothetical protein
VVPGESVEVIGANRLVGADSPALVAVVVRAEEPVVVDLLAERFWPGGGDAAPRTGPAVQAGRLVLDLGLAEDGARVGGVAKHAPDRAAVPTGLAGARAAADEPAGQIGEGALADVATEELGHQRRPDLCSRVADLGLRRGAGDGNRTRALNLGITGQSTRITRLTSAKERLRRAGVPATAPVVDRCSPLYLVRFWCGTWRTADQSAPGSSPAKRDLFAR